jgi:glc operon protein GlcG
VNIARAFRDVHRVLTPSLASLALLALAGTGFAQEPAPVARLEIKDSAGMFDKKMIEHAKVLFTTVSSSIPVTIETIEKLDAQTIEAATRQHAEKSGSQGVYVLISRRDHKIDVLASSANPRVRSDREPIQQAFIRGLREGDFDAALLFGTEAIVAMERAASGVAGGTSSSAEVTSPLVVRNQFRLTLAGAQRVLDGAQKKAVAMNVKENIAVVDDGGHMIAFVRMDGARPASTPSAITKAISAATLRGPTGPLPPGAAAPDLFLNLSLQNAVLAGGGRLTTLPGGIPVVVDGQIIGGVGVGGGTGEQDVIVARAGIEAFEAALKTPAEAPKEAPPAEK